MRRLIYAINVTLDGYCDHTHFNPDDETLAYFTSLTLGADVFVYGRKTYELMVPYWPDIAKTRAESTRTDYEFARAFAAVNKILVFSRSLNHATIENTSIVRSNLYETVNKLKKKEGSYLLTGGVDIPMQLMELGLIDEYHFVVHPVIAGKGRRLFDGLNLNERLSLKLVGSTTFSSGCIALRYRG